ncbi:MAG: HAMP domain-containing histidine kinase [Bacteroidia bacterium]|nr:HAMP domain-containing histidine kinase [Bacteroidia bacterium]
MKKYIENKISRELQQLIEELKTQGNPSDSRWKTRIISVEINKGGNLLSWSNHLYVPPLSFLKGYSRYCTDTLLIDKNRVYYACHKKSHYGITIFLIPLRIDYPIQNNYINDFVFLGSYSFEPYIQKIMSSLRFSHLERIHEGINVSINSTAQPSVQSFVFAISFHDTKPFRYGQRYLATLLIGIGFFFLFIATYLYFRQKKNLAAEITLLLFVISLRGLLLYFHLPTSYVATDLFSSQLLAVNAFSPSLGDLALNTLIVTFLLLRTYQWLPKNLLGLWLLRLGYFSLVVILSIFFATAYFLTKFFLHFFEQVGINSTVYYDFADFSQIDIYSGVLYFAVASLLGSIFIILYYLAHTAIFLQRELNIKVYWLLLALSFVFIASFYASEDWEFSALTVLWCGVILIICYFAGEDWQFSTVHIISILGLFATTSNYAITNTLFQKTEQQLTRLASRLVHQQDILTEYVLDEIVENIRNDEQLWKNFAQVDTLSNEPPTQILINHLVNNHLLHAIRGYDIQVFLFDFLQRRIDAQFELSPYNLSLQPNKKNTLSRYFWLVPHPKNRNQEIYIGRFFINSTFYGPLWIQIELYPKSKSSEQLYPQLLLDQKIINMQQYPIKANIAHYQEGFLIQQYALPRYELPFQTFPLLQKYLPYPPQNRFIETEDYFELSQTFENNNQLIIIRSPKKSFFNKFTRFSYLIYFYGLLYIILLLPGQISRFSLSYWLAQRYLLSFKIQIILILFSLVPLIVLWLQTTAFFTRYYQENTKFLLRKNLKQVNEYLLKDSYFLEELEKRNFSRSATIRDLLTRISNILGCDINIYNPEGKLLSSTKPKIFQAGLASYYINPTSFHAIIREKNSEFITEESIGNLSYLSGYLPLLNSHFHLVGILNIPFLTQHDLQTYQIQEFNAYFINLYILFIVFIVVVGYLTTITITNPLKLLENKMAQTTLGNINTPIKWESKDEIGRIIASYNQMVAKLEESERKLAQSERELAWREMARQVAHEIKNPLTPMKLSIQHLQRLLGENTNPMITKVTNTLLSQIDSLTAIANSFSQFATMPIENKVPLCLQSIIREVYNLYAQEENIQFQLQLPDKEIWILGDKNQMVRILVNLIKNAIQAIELQGQIEITLSCTPSTALLAIKDNGCGIPEELKNKIFEPNFSTKSSGMGLGLAITKRAIESMGGTISFESQVGIGTTFYISLPLYNN